MTSRSFKGHFKVKVKITFSSWVFTGDSHCYKLGQKNRFLPLKTMSRYGLLESSNHFNWLLGSVDDFEDDV